MSIKRSDLAWIVVSDFEKAVKYYTEVLGLKLLEQSPEYGWAELGAPDGGSRLGICQENDEDGMKAGQNAVMTFTVDNLEKSKAALAKKGMKFVGNVIEVPNVVKMQTCSDPDGNMFQLCEMHVG